MENKITREFIEKVRQAKNAEEFVAIAKENEIEIPEGKAKALFEKLNNVLSDEELNGVSGGLIFSTALKEDEDKTQNQDLNPTLKIL